jgi:uncharacterized protein (DUF983 family)
MKGFHHRCPLCGEADSLRLELADVSQMHCSSCEAEVTREDIETIISQLKAILDWIATAPRRRDA